MKNISIVVFIATALILGSCRGDSKTLSETAESPSASHNHNHQHDHNSDHDHSHGSSCSHSEQSAEDGEEIVFPASHAALVDFRVEKVEPTGFREVLKAGGRIMPAPGDQAVIVAPVSGIISFAARNLNDGTSVGKSQTLFNISSSAIAEGDAFVRISADYAKASGDLERAERLLADSIISRREYEEISLAFRQAQIQYDALAGAQTGRGTAVKAPIGGYIAGLDVAEGEYVEVGQRLGSVTQNRKLVLRADVSQRYSDKLSALSGANFTVPSTGSTYSLESMNGRVMSVGKNLAEGSTLIPVSFEFDNNGAVYPGMFVETYLLGSIIENSLVVPLEAVTEQYGNFYVYLQKDEEHYSRREVELGGTDGLNVRVISGLKRGDKVVTRGAVNVRMAAASGDIPHGHEH